MRHRGVLHPHAAEDWALVGDAFCIRGLVETILWPEDGKGVRCLVIRNGRAYQGDPPRLYLPTLVQVAKDCIHVRGFESVRLQDNAMAAVAQEWAVFPKLEPVG